MKTLHHPASSERGGAAPKGFTLIETLFAILIFSAALVSLLTISAKGIAATNEVKNETTAFYLSQEGLEVVRNIRDSNFVVSTSASPVDWMTGIVGTPGNPLCEAAAGCYVSFSPATPPVLVANSGSGPTSTSEIHLTGTGQYGNVGADTGFSRVITVEPSNSNQNNQLLAAGGTNGTGEEYQVTSLVTWTDKGIGHSVQLETFLKRWQ